MEELNKTQLILLALLVSFVTSIATGIVTVALMDQAPPVITQTINRVIKETERIIVPGKTQPALIETVIVKEEDYIVDAVDKNLANIVYIAELVKRKSRLGFTSSDDTKREVVITGMGFSLTPNGYIILSEKDLGRGEEIAIGTQNGSYYKLSILERNSTSKLVIAKIGDELLLADSDKKSDGEKNEVIIDLAKMPEENSAILSFTKAELANFGEVKLGQTAVALGLGASGGQILLGTISRFGSIEKVSEISVPVIYTTIKAHETFNGGPLVNSAGQVMGITLHDESGTYRAISAEFVRDLLERHQQLEKKKDTAQKNAEKESPQE